MATSIDGLARINELNNYKEKRKKAWYKVLGNTMVDFNSRVMEGLSKGVEGIVDAGASLVGVTAGAFGNDSVKRDMAKFVKKDYTGKYVSPLLYGKFTNDSLIGRYKKADKYLGGALNSIGEMLPSIALATATGGGSLVGTATFGATAMGNTTEDTLKQGYGLNKATAYGAVSGAIEAGTEAIGGFKFGANPVKSVASKTLLKTMFEEGMEEVVGEAVDPVARKFILNENMKDNYKLSKFRDSFITGALAGGIMGGAGKVITRTSNMVKYGKQGADLQTTLTEAQTIANEYYNEYKKSDGNMDTKVEEAYKSKLAELSALAETQIEAMKKSGKFTDEKNGTQSYVKDLMANFNVNDKMAQELTDYINSKTDTDTKLDLVDNTQMNNITNNTNENATISGTYSKADNTISVNTTNESQIVSNALHENVHKVNNAKLNTTLIEMAKKDGTYDSIKSKLDNKTYNTEALIDEEVASRYLAENVLNSPKRINQLLSKKPRLFGRVYNALKGNKNVSNVIKAMDNALKENKTTLNEVLEETPIKYKVDIKTPPQAIKDHANLYEDSVIDVKAVKEIMQEIEQEIKDKNNKAIFTNTKEKTQAFKQLFLDLNTESKTDLDNAINNIVDFYKSSSINGVALKDLLGQKEFNSLFNEKFNSELKNAILKAKKDSKMKATTDYFKARLNEKNAKISSLKDRATTILSISRKATRLNDLRKKKSQGTGQLIIEELKPLEKILGRFARKNNLAQNKCRQDIIEYGKLFYNKEHLESIGIVPNDNILSDIALITSNANNKGMMSNEELNAVKNIMANLLHEIKTYDSIRIDGRNQSITDLSTKGIEMTKEAPTFANNPIGKYMQLIANPRIIMERLDGYNADGVFTKLWENIKHGETMSMDLEMKATEVVDDFFKANKKYKSTLNKKVVVEGITMKKSELISLYQISRRQQAKDHVITSGFQLVNGEKITLKDKEAYDKLFESVEKSLTPTDLEFIKAVDTIMNDICRNAKMTTDISLMGFSNVEDGFYFPIRVSQLSLAKNLSDVASAQKEIQALTNYSFNKEISSAKGTIQVGDILNVVQTHIKNVSRYYGLAVPVKNFSLVYNKKIGDTSLGMVAKTKSSYNKKTGQYFVDNYLADLIANVQGVSRSSNFTDGWLNKAFGTIRSNYAKFALGANIKVIAGQATSLFASMKYVSAKNLAIGTATRITSKTQEEMFKYCPYAKYRIKNSGSITAETLSDKYGNITNKLMAGISWMDGKTVGKMWVACKHQCKNDLVKAGQLLEKCIRDVQENSVATEKSALARSNNELIKSMMMFRSQSLQNLSNVVESVERYRCAKKRGDKVAMKQARIIGIKSMTGLLLEAISYTLVGLFFKWVLDRDKEQNIGKDFLEDFFDNNVIGMFPIFSDIYDKITKDYDIDNTNLSMLNETIEALTSLKDINKGNVGVGDFAEPLGQFLGIPTKNIYNYTRGITSKFDEEKAYKLSNIWYHKTPSTMTKNLNEALDNKDFKQARGIFNTMQDDMFKTSTQVSNEIYSIYCLGYDDVLPKRVPSDLNDSQKRVFVREYSKASKQLTNLINSYTYKSLPEELQAKAIKKLSNAFYNNAKIKATGVENEDMTKYDIVSKCNAIDFGYITSCLVKVNSINTSETSSKKQQVIKYLNTLHCNNNLKAIISVLAGYSITEGMSKQLTQYLKARGLSSKDIDNIL